MKKGLWLGQVGYVSVKKIAKRELVSLVNTPSGEKREKWSTEKKVLKKGGYEKEKRKTNKKKTLLNGIRKGWRLFPC